MEKTINYLYSFIEILLDFEGNLEWLNKQYFIFLFFFDLFWEIFVIG